VLSNAGCKSPAFLFSIQQLLCTIHTGACLQQKKTVTSLYRKI
jgi:hypothetical protein